MLSILTVDRHECISARLLDILSSQEQLHLVERKHRLLKDEFEENAGLSSTLEAQISCLRAERKSVATKIPDLVKNRDILRAERERLAKQEGILVSGTHVTVQRMLTKHPSKR